MRILIMHLCFLFTFGCAPPIPDKKNRDVTLKKSHPSIEGLMKNSLELSTSAGLLQSSLLRNIANVPYPRKNRKKLIKYPVCFQSAPMKKGKRKRLKAMIQRSFKLWLDPLKADPTWGKRRVRAESIFRRECPTTRKDLQTFIIVLNPDGGRSYSEYWNYKAVIRRVFSKTDPDFSRTLLHELGHQLGLGDTYSELGYQRPIGQPTGIMNMYWDVPVGQLAPDDKAGILKVWKTISGELAIEECPEGYVPGDSLEARTGTIFCIPASADVDQISYSTQDKKLRDRAFGHRNKAQLGISQP